MVQYKCIKTFLRDHQPELAEAIDRICTGDIKKLHFASGLTFFMPTGEFQKTFIDHASNDVMKADEIFRACIIDEDYPSLSDLHKAGKVVNRLSQEMEIKVAGTTGTLGNGSKVTKNTQFAVPSGVNITIYNLDGPIPTNGKVVERTHIARKAAKKTGGAELSRSRFVLARRVENDYELFKLGKNDLKCCPYTAEVGNLLAYLKHCSNDKAAYEKVAKLVDYNTVASFYIVFEPYTVSGERVLSDEHFNEFIKKGFCPNPSKMIIDSLNEVGGDVDTGMIKRITDVAEQGMIVGPNKLVADVYGGDKKRQAQDEFRDYVDLELAEMESQFSTVHFRDFVNEVAMMTSKFNDVKYTVDQLRYIIKPGTEYYSGSYRFIRTTYFNYTPMSESALKNLAAHGNEDYGQYNDTRLILRNVYHYNKLKSAYSDCTDEYEALKAKIECYAKCATN